MESQVSGGERKAWRARGAWLVVGAIPLLLAIVEGPGHKAIAAAAAWLGGWVGVEWAARRDPALRAFAALRRRGGGAWIVAAVLLGGALSFLLFPLTLIAFAALGVALGVLALWWLSGPSDRFARVAGALGRVATIVLVALVLGEIFCRLPPVVAWDGGHVPGIHRWETENYDRLWEHNALGLRSLHLDDAKPAGTLRVLALGDNQTFGALIARTEDTWPHVLERELTQSGVAVQSVNAGRQGFTTANEAEWLGRYGATFDPDLLVVQFALNDVVPSRPNFGSERSFFAFHLRPLIPGLHRYLEPKSYLYAALDSFKEHQEMRWLHPEGYRPLYEDGMIGWEQCKHALGEMAAWARERGMPALLVLFPDLEPDTSLVPGSYRYEAVHAKVRAEAERAGLTVLDLYPTFAAQGKPPEAWWPLPCEPLPGVEAQRLAAHAIAQEIASANLLAQSARSR